MRIPLVHGWATVSRSPAPVDRLGGAAGRLGWIHTGDTVFRPDPAADKALAWLTQQPGTLERDVSWATALTTHGER